MSRSPGGGASYGNSVHGKTGERGMGARFSGQKGMEHRRNKLSWKDPAMKTDTTKSQRKGPMPRQDDRYNKLSRNPSGAANYRGMGLPVPEL